jgi:predicted nucleotidyltransferase
MKLEEILFGRIAEFEQICKDGGVKSLFMFGSLAKGTFSDRESDIDLLIDMKAVNPLEKGENLMRIWDQFERFFQRKVDLLTLTSIRNPILKKEIEGTKVLLYDGERLKISV